jgi:hypothetical protein
MASKDFAESMREQLQMMGRSQKDLEMRMGALEFLQQVETGIRESFGDMQAEKRVKILEAIADAYALVIFGLCERTPPEKMTAAITQVMEKLDAACKG